MKDLTLDDKYTATAGRVYLSGAQALVRLPLMQRQRDLAIGLNTAGFISGYRGSPLGVYDLALWQAQRFLTAHHVHFQPGVNEDLAATAVWGSQQVKDIGESPWDGVFAMWYGKGPGVDRSGDPLKHGNYAGSSRHGGVLVLCGDDHGARSSTLAHQSDPALIHFGMPISVSGHDPGIPRLRALRLCTVTLRGLLGRLQVRDRRGRRLGLGGRGSAARAHRRSRGISRCRRAGST